MQEIQMETSKKRFRGPNKPKSLEQKISHGQKIRDTLSRLDEARLQLLEKDKEILGLNEKIAQLNIIIGDLNRVIYEWRLRDKKRAWVNWRLGVNNGS